MVSPMILNLNHMQNHIMENIFLFHAYMNSRSNNSRLLSPTPENHALAPTNVTIWVITSLVMRLFPYQKKVEAIQSLAVPKNGKQLRQFIGMINFYRDMWQKRSDILAPLTALTYKNVKDDWKDEHQKYFDAIKRVIVHEVLLAYPDFNAPFEIHNDASKLQIGALIYQNGQPHRFILTKDEHRPT